MTDTAPSTVIRTLLRKTNAEYRPREYLTEAEVEKLIQAARKRGRNGLRDSAAILLAYRHGLRAQELCSLQWSQIDLRHGRLHVNRAKGGIESVHPLHGPELRALRPLLGSSPYVFLTEAGTPVTTSWFLRMIQRTGQAAKLPFPIHPTSSRTMDRTPGAWRIISGIGICNQQRGIPPLRRIGSGDGGRIRAVLAFY